jgi:hypothetical protein
MSHDLESLLDPKRRADCAANDTACSPKACLTCGQGRHCPLRRTKVAARHQRPNPPFFNGRIWIGIAYVPKPMPMEAEAQRVQSALLEPRTAERQTMPQRLIGRIWRWL